MLNPKSYQEVNEEINNYYSIKKKNIWRNNFHIEAPFGLINDPNGLNYYDNKFHIFYQWNPFGCEHKTKHWALVTTTDFVNFTRPKVVLKPEDWFDKNGCYSGCGVVKGDDLKLYYTGNVRNSNNERESYQCIATYHKDGTLEKEGVIIQKQPDGYTAHFRDPYVFIKDEQDYMVLGVQTEGLKGKALIYNSRNSKEWKLLGELKTNMHDFGYMWECPNMIKLYEDKYAFIFSPQGLESEEFKYQNIYQSGYVIGNLDLEKVELRKHTEFKELDMGFDFYAPQVFKYEDKNILIGWIGMPDKDSEYPTSEKGWIYSLTLPRVLEYKDNVLYQKPFDKLGGLRQTQELQIENYVCDEYNLELNSKGKEIMLNLDMTKDAKLEIKLKFNDEYILLTYDKKAEVFIIDRTNMSLGGKGIRKFKLKAEEELKLHMFIDSSVIEIYYQDGLEVTTLMYFPKEEQLEIQIKNDYEIKIKELSMWNLRSVSYEE
ncbi:MULTISPECIES: glycoside hydrolase family 32 protein [Clostridium]|uniref:glycoside hydrolase family 32 protein n=1 Tax=Clostridium TaxID=1485 RepID=UPI000983BC0A|nr:MULTISPECIES: sucrose-6-phosphate hydrolase [Clostridium]AQR98051.1 sucrose-6-phosphate hydrolase [Clostridium saccharoperbutylacetonicum]NSB33944.1 beta-fructofuranosidase [Clostridium saccharoperbutylacetonicum]